MSIETNLRGRLRNTPLPQSHGLLPLFEAIVNSIHAIEDASLPTDVGEIRVQVIRDPQQMLALSDDSKKRGTADIVGFRVSDNGVGFNDANLDSFRTLDSEGTLALAEQRAI